MNTELYERHPQLKSCEREIATALGLLADTVRAGGRILVCGNGGSAADAEHIVGELLKSFRKRRPVDAATAAKLPREIADRLEGAIPAISLVSMGGFLTAFSNDVGFDLAFAQEVYALGRPGDALLALSTSGASVDCVNAALVARAKGLKVVSLVGARGGKLADASDVAIKVPETETHKVQELHLPVYHALCAQLEDLMF